MFKKPYYSLTGSGLIVRMTRNQALSGYVKVIEQVLCVASVLTGNDICITQRAYRTKRDVIEVAYRCCYYVKLTHFLSSSSLKQIFNSSSCFWSTSFGQSSIGETAKLFFGNAIASRMEF